MKHAGLDAFVFLGFFKSAMKLLVILTILASTVISPIRWYYTGRYDQGDDNDGSKAFFKPPPQLPTNPSETFEQYLWTYVVFTYIFTGLTGYYMLRQTLTVLRVRQKYLGHQNSITDRTIKLSGIPPTLRTETALKDYIEALGIGLVRKVHLCLNYASLDALLEERKNLIYKLEHAWAKYLGITVEANGQIRLPDDDDEAAVDYTHHHHTAAAAPPVPQNERPQERLGPLGLSGPQVDTIEYYTAELENLDTRIRLARAEEYVPTDTAFVTMDSVASAQMAAQAVLDPRPRRFLASLAPAPHDVVWSNLYLSFKEQFFRTYSITLLIAILTVVFVFPVSYLASFLNPKTIQKLWPSLYQLIDWDGWTGTFITGILPPLIFTLLNFLFPYLYWYLAKKQGFISQGDVELSVISKNFFYVFFNMFLVFTVAGTVSDVWALLKDTTKIAFNLAKSLTRFSLFYVDLIILQGVGVFPLRLLQIDRILALPLMLMRTHSARDYRNFFRPPIFSYGLNLPQPILILIIVLLYSVISTKILFFGALYFLIGYYTYKYQLLYGMVHPQHSTGRSWIIIMRRVMVGVILFHLTMAGILALREAYILAFLLAPLPIATFIFWYNFEDDYVPLSSFIALTAIETHGSASGPCSSVASDSEDEDLDHAPPSSASRPSTSASTTTATIRRRSSTKTLDEEREQYQTYINPNLTSALDGPWIALEGVDYVFVANGEGAVRRKVRLEEWE